MGVYCFVEVPVVDRDLCCESLQGQEEIEWETSLPMQLREQAKDSLEEWFPSVCASQPEAKPFPFMARVCWGCSLQSFLQRGSPPNSETLETISLQLKAALR